jgi:hypothetical protein
LSVKKKNVLFVSSGFASVEGNAHKAVFGDRLLLLWDLGFLPLTNRRCITPGGLAPDGVHAFGKIDPSSERVRESGGEKLNG